MRTVYGDAAVAKRLRTARLAAGHESGREAALSAGWSPNTYKAHEGGRRAVTEVDAAKYAGAFNVTLQWLLSGVGPAPAAPTDEQPVNESPYHELDEPGALANARRRTEAVFAANRLQVARRLAGFATATEACRPFAFVRPTYGGHEYGEHPLPTPWIAIYAAAFGVTEGWLRTGSPPSDLPPDIAEAVRNAEGCAGWIKSMDGKAYRAWYVYPLERRLAQSADPGRRGSLARVGALRRRLRSERINGAASGHDLLILEAGGDSTGDRERWGVPPTFLSGDGGADPGDVVVLRCDRDLYPVAGVGDRLVVDLAHPLDRGGVLVMVDPAGNVRLCDPQVIDASSTGEEPVRARVLAVIRRGP